MNAQLEEKLRAISLLIMDVDGVLTRGDIVYDTEGNELKFFHVQDGLGIVILHKCGFKTAIMTSRESDVVRIRAAELGIGEIIQNASPKIEAYRSLLKKLALQDPAVCYIGDDLSDIQVIKRAGVGCAVSNAAEEVLQAADYITTAAGGEGAVREVIELILKAKGLWDDIVAVYA